MNPSGESETTQMPKPKLNYYSLRGVKTTCLLSIFNIARQSQTHHSGQVFQVMNSNLGFDVTLVSDATATFDRNGEDGVYYSADQIHRVHLASLNGEFCTVLTTDEVLRKLDDQSNQFGC